MRFLLKFLMKFWLIISPGSQYELVGTDNWIYYPNTGGQRQTKEWTQDELDNTPRKVIGKWYSYYTIDGGGPSSWEQELTVDSKGIPDVEPVITSVYKKLSEGSGGFGGEDEDVPDPTLAPADTVTA